MMLRIEPSQELSLENTSAEVYLKLAMPRDVYDFFVVGFGWEDYFIYSLLDIMWADLDAKFIDHPRCEELKTVLREAQSHVGRQAQ